MNLLTSKHPKDMTREELELYRQEMQEDARRKGQHYPTTMHNGKIEENTLRKEATLHHEERYAQNTATSVGKGMGLFESIMNMTGMVTGAKNK